MHRIDPRDQAHLDAAAREPAHAAALQRRIRAQQAATQALSVKAQPAASTQRHLRLVPAVEDDHTT